MKPINIQVIPALVGYSVVYDLEDTKEVVIGEPIIAWRVETYEKNDGQEVFSSCVPITVDGDPATNCIAVKNPDNSITSFEDSNYDSIGDFQQNKYSR